MEKYNGKSNSSQQMPSFLQAIGAIPGAPRQSGASSMRSSQISGINQSSTSSFHPPGSSSRPISSTPSLAHHQLPSDSTLQGGKTVHHMGQLGISKIKTKDPPVVKIEVGLNPTNPKKQRRSSSGGDGPMRSGSDSTSSDFVFPPVKKIKLEIGDAGVWETKKEEVSPTNSGGAVGGVVDPVGNEKTDDDEDDDGCPVDYKSRCVILIEEEMQNIVKDFKACTTELFYLENDGNILDYHDWSKKSNSSLDDYIDQLAAKHEMAIKGFESEEAKVFTSGSGTLPTITPVVISKKLPPAIAAYNSLQQKQNLQNESTESHVKRFVGGLHSVVYGHIHAPQWRTVPLAPGGIPLSTTAATTTIGSPTPLNSSENAPGSNRVATVTMGTANHQGGLVRPIPIVAVPSSAAGLLPSKSYADPMSISQSSIVTTPVISSVIPSQTTVELAEQVDTNDEPLEAMVVSRVQELRRQGLWSVSRLPKIVEPERSKGHWDLLLAEMEWMAVDFALERRWKMASSGMIARSVIRSEAVAKRKMRRRKEEERKKELASGVSRIVEEFWVNAQEEFLLKKHVSMDKERKEMLESIIVSAAKDLLDAEKNLVSNIDPNLYPISESGESDDHEQEVKELLTSAEWPMDSVLRQYYPKLFEETFHNKGVDNDNEQTNSNLLEISDDEISEMQEQWGDLTFAKNKYESVDDFLLDIPMVDEAEALMENNLFVGDIKFRPYQIAGCLRLNKFHQRGVTYVEVRDAALGTKLQMAFHISSLASNLREWGCHLVVIREQADLYSWHSTFAKFAPSMKVKVTKDESKDWGEDSDLKYSLKDAVENFNVLVTYASHFEQHSEIYQRYKWKTIVIDKVIDLNLPKNAIISYLKHFNYKHLIVFIDASSTPPDILSLVTDDDDGKMEVSSIQSESWMELVTLTLKDKICDSNPDWMGDIPALEDEKKPNLHLSMDEAVKVFRSLATCTRRGQVIDQLNALNVLTLACPLPVKQALKYNEIFAQLLEESPDVTSKKFLNQINELYNTCAHLDDLQSDQSHSSSLHMVSPLTSDPHPLSLELLTEKVDDKDLSNTVKNLLTLYSWGAGLVDQIDKKENNLSSNQMEDFPYNIDLLKSLADCLTNHKGTSHLDKLNSLKQIIAEVDESKILDSLPDDVAKSFRNILFLMQPSIQKGSSSQSFQFEVKEEVMDYSYGDEMVENGEHNEEEVFEELGSECLKELTNVGRKCFDEEFKKFLMSCRMVVARLSEHLSKKQSDWSSAKQLITPLVKSRDDLTNEIKELDHVDRKITGRDKGKLSSLCLLLDKEGLALKGQRFVTLTCHRSTAFELQSFLSSKGITYVSIDSGFKANKVRRSIDKFNCNKKYDCLVMHHPSRSWKSFMRILGPDFLPSAGNLVVLDEELADDQGGLLWQLLAKRMCASRDLNLIRMYHGGSVEGYQVQLRWSEEVMASMVRGRGFNARLKRFDRRWSDGKDEFLDTDNRMGDDDDDDCIVKLDGNDNGEGLEFIYTSHQDALKHSPGGVMTRHCSCLDELSYDDDDDDGKLFMLTEKQIEIQSYAMSVMNRQLKSSEMMLRREGRSSGRVNIRKLFDLKDDIPNEVNDPSVYEAQAYDDLLTYEVDYLDPECFISDLTGEKMPVWAPPTPPHDDDVYVDRNLHLLYESSPMSETQLPSVYMRKGNKRMKMDESGRNVKSSREFKPDTSVPGMQRPKSLFERPPNPAQTNAIPVSTANSFAFGFHVDRDGRLINKAGIPVGQPYARSPTVQLPVPRPEAQDQFDWLIHEDWALLQAYQMTCLDYNLQPESASPNHPPPQSRLPNWELIACIINGFSRVFRSARQSRLRYENVIVPREEGRSQFDNAQRKLKKTSKGLYKTSKCSRQLKTIQMYSQDNNRSLTTHLSHRFDLLKNALGKINCHKTTVPTPLVKTNHAAIMAENNINYDQPLSALSIAEMKLERASKEKEKRAVTAPERIQQTPPISTPSTPLVNVLAIQQQQQQQQTSSEGSASTPLSTSLTVPIGGGLSVVLPNSQLRMAVPAVVGNQQQQQVILQAAVAQQQMAIVASAASNSLLGKVPLVSGVGNTMPAVRNLTNLSFVVNQSAATNQQNTTFVAVSKAPGTVASTVGIVTSLSPATLKAIRNINPAAANQLVSTINIGQNKAMPPGTAFPPGRIAIRGAGTIQLNQRLTQKPATSQQQVTLTPGNNLAGIQKVSSLGVVSVPTTQMGQTFHVKNPQVLLKQKQQSTGAQQLTGSTVVSRLAASSTNQGTALQLQHLQLQSKTPQLLEVMQASSAQQQILAASLSSAQVSGINVTALIKTVSANSNLGKAVTPAQTAIRQTHMAKRPTVTAINIQGQGNRTALMGMQQVAKGSSQVIYQQPKLVIQPQSVVKQQPGVQLQQGTAILAMTPRGPAVNISALGLGSTIATGNGMAIPINPSSLTPSSQHVRVAKQMINSPKVAPMVQHITVRGPAQQLVSTTVTSVTIATSGTVIRSQQNPSSSA